MVACHKYRGDCEEVGRKILDGVVRALTLAVNHEFAVFETKEETDEVDSDPRKAVLVHDDNFSDSTLFQQAAEPFALEVDPRADVFDDFVRRIRLMELFDLAFEVAFLLGGADPGVDESLVGGGCIAWSIVVVRPATKLSLDVLDVVDTLPLVPEAQAPNTTSRGSAP